MCLDLLGKQVALDIDHDILKIQNRNKTRTVFIGSPKTFNSVLLMEIVQELAEFVIGYQSLLALAKVELHERRVHVKGNAIVQIGFFDHLHKLR